MKFLVLAILLCSSTALANPILWNPKPGRAIELVHEDLQIEVHDKFSTITGRFRFADLTRTTEDYAIKLPIFQWKIQKDLGPVLNSARALVTCGDVHLRITEAYDDPQITKLVSEYSNEVDVLVLDFKIPETCKPSDPLSISYRQQNFRVGDTAVLLYLPLIPGVTKRSPHYRIEIVNRTSGNLKLIAPKEDGSKKVNNKIEVYPVDKEIIVVGYGKASEYKIEPFFTGKGDLGF